MLRYRIFPGDWAGGPRSTGTQLRSTTMHLPKDCTKPRGARSAGVSQCLAQPGTRSSYVPPLASHLIARANGTSDPEAAIGGNDGGDSYIIRGGKVGSDRLSILANATWPTSKQFLLRAGMLEGMRCLDVGCGNGDISMRLFEILGTTGSVFGIDMDQTKIDIARQKLALSPQYRASFDVVNVLDDPLERGGKYDFIYVRLVLSHLSNPAKLLEKLRVLLQPGGIVAVEDVEFDGHHCHPDCGAFDRYVELYKAAAALRGADANIGPKLRDLIQESGYRIMQCSSVTPQFNEGDGKMMAHITMEAISAAVIEAGLASQEEVTALLRELAVYSQNSGTTMSIPTFHQISFGV